MKTLIVIAALLIVASAMYFADSGAFPWEAQQRSLSYFSEDNGVLGRILDFWMGLYWNPGMFAMSLSGVIAGSAGLAVYWTRIED